MRRVVDAALPLAAHVPDPLPAELREREGLALKRDALAAVHRPRDLDEAETGRQRLAFEELLVLQIGIARRAAEREQTLAPALGEPGDLIHRYREALPFALTPYQEQAIREIDGDLARTVADAAAPAGRRRLGQDGRRALRAPARGRERAPGRAHGADRNARRAALPHDRRPLPRARRQLRAPHELVEEARARGGARRRRRRRHARADPGGRRAARPRGRGRRRAAPLRRRAALGARGGPRPARPPHDRDADPAHARAHRLRRPRGLGDREAAGVAQARDHELDHRGSRVGGVHAADPAAARGTAGVRRLSADRGVRDVARPRRGGGGRAAAARRAARLPRRLPPRPAQGRRAPRPHGPLQGARARRPRRDDGDRGRRRRRRTRR